MRHGVARILNAQQLRASKTAFSVRPNIHNPEASAHLTPTFVQTAAVSVRKWYLVGNGPVPQVGRGRWGPGFQGG